MLHIFACPPLLTYTPDYTWITPEVGAPFFSQLSRWLRIDKIEVRLHKTLKTASEKQLCGSIDPSDSAKGFLTSANSDSAKRNKKRVPTSVNLLTCQPVPAPSSAPAVAPPTVCSSRLSKYMIQLLFLEAKHHSELESSFFCWLNGGSRKFGFALYTIAAPFWRTDFIKQVEKFKYEIGHMLIFLFWLFTNLDEVFKATEKYNLKSFAIAAGAEFRGELQTVHCGA